MTTRFFHDKHSKGFHDVPLGHILWMLVIRVTSMAFVASACLIFIKCKNEIVQPQDFSFSLNVDDVSCAEVWLDVHLGSAVQPRTVQIWRETCVTGVLTLSAPDTTLVDTALLPGKAYTYHAVRLDGTSVLGSTSVVQAITLDTTSGNFTFAKETLKGSASSILYDVALVNDTLAYAVGQAYGYDSLGQGDPYPYCLAKWDGQSWRLLRLYFLNSNRQLTMITVPIQGVYAFGPTDVWLAPGSVFHWNGSDSLTELSFNRLTLADRFATVIRLWGSSDSDMFGVGDAGTIVHYDGTSWRTISSGTTLQLVDIYGATNMQTGQRQILAVGTENYPGDRAILSISSITASLLPTNPIQYELFGVWFVPNRHYYVVGSGVYEKSSLVETAWHNNPLDITRYGTTKMRGNGLNDVFVVGAYGELLHYNGMRWKSFRDVTGLDNGSYASVAVKGNLIIAVGANNNDAIVTVGRR